ncbi:hypothetical protein GYMLUDRAFT_156973 [Collybiopsis luxurians FD-317 M1]|nr:hypothetical protein GYMLUDRAFT_156973 [Collybiopsis luxurians FD-317 M1]
MIRKFQCICMNKCASYGRHTDGISAAGPGDLTVKFPACPYPSINLPKGWKDVLFDKKWIYKLFTAMDGNMKAVRLNASSEQHVPGFNVGRTYFVDPTVHHHHVATFDKCFPNPPSTCNDHKAVSSAGSRAREMNCTISGVFSIFCAQHDTFRPQGTTDLRYSERQVEVDLSYVSSLPQDAPDQVASSYNAMCQYSVKFANQVDAYPPKLQLPKQIKNIQFLVPKFHLNAHQESCRVAFSFNLAPCVGQTDGEAPERCWSLLNPLSSSTKRMSPGGRWDTMDDHLTDWNWRKSITLGALSVCNICILVTNNLNCSHVTPGLC